MATTTSLSQDVLGYPGTTQTWDSRICDYLHRLITGYPGIIPGCPGISQTWYSDLWLPPQTYPRMSWDIPGLLRPGTLGSVATFTGLSQDVLGYPRMFRNYPRTTQTWDSRICGYLHKLIPGCPGIIPGQLGSVATSTGLSQDIPGLSQDVPGYLRPGTLGSVATSTSLSQDVPGLSQDNSDLWLPLQAYPRISRDYPRMSRDISDLGL